MIGIREINATYLRAGSMDRMELLREVAEVNEMIDRVTVAQRAMSYPEALRIKAALSALLNMRKGSSS